MSDNNGNLPEKQRQTKSIINLENNSTGNGWGMCSDTYYKTRDLTYSEMNMLRTELIGKLRDRDKVILKYLSDEFAKEYPQLKNVAQKSDIGRESLYIKMRDWRPDKDSTYLKKVWTMTLMCSDFTKEEFNFDLRNLKDNAIKAGQHETARRAIETMGKAAKAFDPQPNTVNFNILHMSLEDKSKLLDNMVTKNEIEEADYKEIDKDEE